MKRRERSLCDLRKPSKRKILRYAVQKVRRALEGWRIWKLRTATVFGEELNGNRGGTEGGRYLNAKFNDLLKAPLKRKEARAKSHPEERLKRRVFYV